MEKEGQGVPKSPVTLIPLGGTEKSKNMTVVEYGDDIVVIDASIAFPDEELWESI